MRIRCERCSTVYELDEARLSPQGAAVKCTRCQLVFRAFPPAPAPEAAPSAGTPEPHQDDRTAVFGYAPPASPEPTASFATAAAPEPGPVREGAPRTVRVRSASLEPPARPGRQAWILLLVGAFAVAALLAWLAMRPAGR